MAAEVNPYESDLPVGTVIPAVSAVGWPMGHRNCDVRPRLVDKLGVARLVDSGSQVTTTSRTPADKKDNFSRLMAVNGSKIETYGVREIEIKINRKSYTINAIVCDMGQDILGMDFINKYRLGLEWDDFDQTELYLVDKKAGIKSLLQMVTVPTNLQRNYLSPEGAGDGRRLCDQSGPVRVQSGEDAKSVQFQVSCIKKLGQEEEKVAKKSVEEQLQSHDPKYVSLLKKYPALLNPNFVKGEPVHGVWHKIDTGTHPPSKAKRRPIVSNAKKAAAGKAAWDQMIADGIVEKVKAGDNTEWASALHIVDKPGGGARPCSDFRDLNKKTLTESYPLPLLRDFTSKIHGCKVFSVVDLKSAFFNVPIWPPHRHKTTTLSPWGGAYVYNRLPFGLSSGPSTWQLLLETVLKDIPSCFLYLDDVLIFEKNQADHDRVLETVFKRLAENNMALSIDKCKFGQSEVDYLGYRVSSRGIRPLPKKLDALDRFQPPKSQKDVLHFCGALNYFRTSLRGVKRPDGTCKSAAAVLQPLYAIGTEKLPKSIKFQEIWDKSPALQNAFLEAKTMLKDAVELCHPNPNYPLALFSDASDHSVGGALQMLTPEGRFEPLGFYSAHLTPTQQKYSVFKKELLGVFKSLRHFLPEVYGKHLTIYTDHLPVKNAFESNNIPLNDPQVFRQITEISRFTRDVKHISGIDNTFADYLSRVKENKKGTVYQEPGEEDTLEVSATESVKFQLLSLAALQDLQKECPEIKKIQEGDMPKYTKFGMINLDDWNIFCEISSSTFRPYIPKEMRHQVISSLHFDHLGIKSTTKRVAEEFYWPSLKEDVKKFCKMCNSCMKVKSNNKLVNDGEFSVPDKRFSHVMVDVVGPLPDSYGYKFILTAIDRTTRFLHCFPLREASASEAATAFLQGYVALMGLPSVVTSDNGASFTAGLWKGMMEKLNIEVKYSALYRPQSIGMLERQHRSIKDSLKAAIEDMTEKHQSKWMDYLPFVLLGKRVAMQPDIGASPSQMTFGVNPRIPGQILHDPGEVEDEESLQKLLCQVRNKTQIIATQPSRHNPPQTALPGIPEGVTQAYTRQHQRTGLQAPFEGPFDIHSRPSRSTVKLKVGTFKDGEGRFEIRHVNDLKFAHPDSLAAPIQRPRRGRPSARVDSPSNTDGQTMAAPEPTPSNQSDSSVNNATGAAVGRRPVRATRNPAPKYIDAVELAGNSNAFSTHAEPTSKRWWVASQAELDVLNRSINR